MVTLDDFDLLPFINLAIILLHMQIFEFIKYFGPAQQKCKIMVTSVVGHVYGLDFENGRVRDLADLFKVLFIE